MTPAQEKIAAEILKDAANSAHDRQDVLGRANTLGRQLGGEDRWNLTEKVHAALDQSGAIDHRRR
jgi:hypothetical protein